MAIFFKPLPLGTVVQFRHMSPTAHDRAPMVFILSMDYEGMLHGLNMRYLNPTTTAQLQWIFKNPQQQAMIINPFKQELYNQQKQAQEEAKEIAQQRKQEIMSKQVGVVVKPQRGNPFGIKTFGQTQPEVQPAYPGHPGIKVPSLMIPPAQPSAQQQNLISYMDTINKDRSLFGRNPITGNPQQFYYQYIKPLFGSNQHIAQVYRKYKHEYIQNLRIVHTSISVAETPEQYKSPFGVPWMAGKK